MSKLGLLKSLVCLSVIIVLGQMAGCASVTTEQVATPSITNPIIKTITVKNDAIEPKIALVLGSGGARGYAHIGVIKELESHGIQPDLIVGTSAGSIVGALYASGKSAAELEHIAMSLKPTDVRDFTLSTQGFFDGGKIEQYINQQIQNKKIEELRIPLYIVATELKKGEATIFNSGNTGRAVRASTSIPSMFVPTKIDDKEYVDGGLVSPLPVEVAKQLGADVIIAVDILARPEHTETSNVWGLFNQNINVMQNRLASYEAKLADIVIQPDIREKQHVFSTKSRQDTMKAGQYAAQSHIQQIQLVLEQKRAKLALNSANFQP